MAKYPLFMLKMLFAEKERKQKASMLRKMKREKYLKRCLESGIEPAEEKNMVVAYHYH